MTAFPILCLYPNLALSSTPTSSHPQTQTKNLSMMLLFLSASSRRACTETAVSCLCLTLGYNNSPAMANNREVIDTLPIVGPACSTPSCPNSTLQHVTIALLN